MLAQPTLEKLRSLRLNALASAWETQSNDPSFLTLPFDERLGLLVDAECMARDNKRIQRNLKDARLKHTQACIENIDYPPRRELDRAVIRQLATCDWLEKRIPVVITGPTGTGKSYISCALANHAARRGYRVTYRRVPRLFEELALAHADGSYLAYIDKLAKMDLLVLDDWGIAPLKDQHRQDFLQVMDDRIELKSTIVTSQLSTELWHDYVGDPTVADAVCDRTLSRAHRIVLKGPSRRRTENTEEDKK